MQRARLMRESAEQRERLIQTRGGGRGGFSGLERGRGLEERKGGRGGEEAGRKGGEMDGGEVGGVMVEHVWWCGD